MDRRNFLGVGASLLIFPKVDIIIPNKNKNLEKVKDYMVQHILSKYNGEPIVNGPRAFDDPHVYRIKRYGWYAWFEVVSPHYYTGHDGLRCFTRTQGIATCCDIKISDAPKMSIQDRNHFADYITQEIKKELKI